MKFPTLTRRPRRRNAEDDAPVLERRDDLITPRRQHRLGRTVAVRFDSRRLELAVVSHGLTSPRLLHVRTEAIPPDIRSDEERDAFIGQSVAAYVKKYGGPIPQVYITLDGPDTAARSLVLPELPARKLRGAVAFEAKRQIPFPIEQAVIDHRVVSRLGTEEEPRVRVLLYAATEKCIARHLTTLTEQRVRVQRVYHSQDVIGSLLRRLPDYDPREIYAVAQLSNRQLEISFFRGCSLRYWHVGRSAIGWPNSPDGRLSSEQAPLIADQIAQEMQLAFDFYAGKFSDGMASKLYLFGNHVVDAEVLTALYQSSGIECALFPVHQISGLGDIKAVDQQTVLAALPVVATASNNIALANLLPAHLRSAQRARQIDRLAVIGHAAAIVILAAGWFAMYNGAAYREDRLAEVTSDIRDVETSPAFEELQLVTRQNMLDRAYLNMVKKAPSFLSLTLKEISNLADKRITLTDLNFEETEAGDNMLLQGRIVSTDTPPEMILAEFMQELSGSAMFSDVVAERHLKRRQDGRLEMDFVLRLRGHV